MIVIYLLLFLNMNNMTFKSFIYIPRFPSTTPYNIKVYISIYFILFFYILSLIKSYIYLFYIDSFIYK